MDLQTFGRGLLDVLADRALRALRTTSYEGLLRLAAPTPAAPTAASGSLSAFAAGAVLGAGLAALTTPVTGRELRQQLMSGGRRVQRRAKDLAAAVGGDGTTASQGAAPVRRRSARPTPAPALDGATPKRVHKAVKARALRA